MMAVLIQKPPNDDRAVAEKVFPRASSLHCVSVDRRVKKGWDSPHARQELNKTSVAKSWSNDDAKDADVSSSKVYQAEKKGRQSES